MRLLSTFALLTACTDYDLNEKRDPPPADTGTPDTAEPTPDTADTAAPPDTADTGGGVVVDTGEDTGEPEQVATESVYINTSDTLYSFDPATGIATRIGDFEQSGRAVSGGMTDIAIDLDGHMFGVSFDALYTIDPATAACTFVATVADEMTGLTFVSDGRLVGAGTAVSFIDTASGRLTTLVPVGEYTTSGDIIGLPDGMLYWTVTGGDQLVQVDPNDGSTRRRGSIGETGVYGLGYAYGALYGFTSAREVIEIDATSGHVVDARALAGEWWGATTNPVLW